MADLAGVNSEGEALKDLVVMSYMVHLETIFRTVTRVSTEKKRVVRRPLFPLSAIAICDFTLSEWNSKRHSF